MRSFSRLLINAPYVF